VGVRKARDIARAHRLPLVPIHHMEAHALVARLTEEAVNFPFVVLLVSGMLHPSLAVNIIDRN
jgi:N6-L-threonylcarbamoyladenine synthase